MLGYKNRSFEYASLINSGLLVFFRLIFDQEIYFRVRKFHGLVFFRVNMGLINKVDMVCLSPVGYGV